MIRVITKQRVQSVKFIARAVRIEPLNGLPFMPAVGRDGGYWGEVQIHYASVLKRPDLLASLLDFLKLQRKRREVELLSLDSDRS